MAGRPGLAWASEAVAAIPCYLRDGRPQVSAGENDIDDHAVDRRQPSGCPGRTLRFASTGPGGTTVAGDVDGDAVSDFHIVLTGTIALLAGDFIL